MAKAVISGGKLQGVIVVLIMATVLFSMAPTLIGITQDGIVSLSTELGNTTKYGTGAGGLAGSLGEWAGYFWLVAVVGAVLGVALYAFKIRRR